MMPTGANFDKVKILWALKILASLSEAALSAASAMASLFIIKISEVIGILDNM
jgi:hypothetical protein